MAKRNKARVDAWIDETVTAPRQFVPNPQENKRAKFVRKYVWFSTWALLPVMVLSLGVIANVAAPPGEDLAVTVDGFDQTNEGRDALVRARLALDEWLDADTSPLPTATVLSFDGSVPADPVAPETVTNASGDQVEVERHNVRVFRFSLSTGNGSVWLASVPVGFSASGAQVAASPSVMPAVPSETSAWSGQAWPGERTVQASSHVGVAIDAWGRAFTSGDPDQLRNVVGDPNPEHSYLPIAGAAFQSTSISRATVRLQDLEPDGAAPADPTYIVVRVLLSVTWPGQEGARTNDIRPMTFDVLVAEASTASPRVVAWGPAGQGGALEPFANAITDRQVGPSTPAPVPGETPASPTETTPDETTDPDQSADTSVDNTNSED